MRVQEKDNMINLVFSNADLKAIKRSEKPITLQLKSGVLVSFLSDDALAKMSLNTDKLIRKPKKDEAINE